MWKIVDTFERRYLQWPESEMDLVFPTQEVAQVFISLNLDEENRFQPEAAGNHGTVGGMASPNIKRNP
jgi:hypothetical protein